MTHFALERHFDKYTKSPVLQHIQSQGILHRLLNRSELIEWRLEKATKQVRTRLSGGNAVLNFFKWWVQKDCILDLFPEMDCVKTSLLLLMSTTQLEVLNMERNDSYSDSEKVNSIEGQMTKETYQSSSSDKSMPAVSSAPTHGTDSTAKACFHDQEALYKEERRFQRERIPSHGSRSAKTTPLVPSVPLAPTRGIDDESGASSNVQEAGSVNGSHSERQRFGIPPQRLVEVNTANFEKSVVHYHSLDNGRQLSGKVLTGVINTTLEVSIISILEAKRLELDVVSSEEDKEIWFTFDQGKSQLCIGMVSVGIYHKGIGQSHTTYRMYVLENCHPRLILGREFCEVAGISEH
ncbi:hypothetical protein CSAL01_11687 [Colletotrichum salicis]|uniref:Uncharacterized protein n=1 Tax=Colletotrichum salicis TaxID=1209931 RepID=A0A135UIK7_9PEZI|nr:hypothetical protein CSAL01_11687 [Colletotrichum salicis]